MFNLNKKIMFSIKIKNDLMINMSITNNIFNKIRDLFSPSKSPVRNLSRTAGTTGEGQDDPSPTLPDDD